MKDLLDRQIVLSMNDTSFVKKGKHSVGVKRQYCSRLEKIENCQSGVFLAYSDEKGHRLVNYELYIPRECFSDKFAHLCEECNIPEGHALFTKNGIARGMTNQMIECGQFQTRWVDCDAIYGNDHVFLDGTAVTRDGIGICFL